MLPGKLGGLNDRRWRSLLDPHRRHPDPVGRSPRAYDIIQKVTELQVKVGVNLEQLLRVADWALVGLPRAHGPFPYNDPLTLLRREYNQGFFGMPGCWGDQTDVEVEWVSSDGGTNQPLRLNG